MATKGKKTSKPSDTTKVAQAKVTSVLPVAQEVIGIGGELHQVAADGQLMITTNHGMPISDDHNSLKAGPRGPVLLEDFILREKIWHFDHERIDRKSTRLNSSHVSQSRMPSSA